MATDVTFKHQHSISPIKSNSMVWYGNILFDIVHNIIENILPKHKNM